MVSTAPVFYQLDASNTCPLRCSNKNVSRCCQMSPKRQNLPWLKTSAPGTHTVLPRNKLNKKLFYKHFPKVFSWSCPTVWLSLAADEFRCLPLPRWHTLPPFPDEDSEQVHGLFWLLLTTSPPHSCPHPNLFHISLHWFRSL